MMDYTEQMERDIAFFDRRIKERDEKPLTAEEATRDLQRAGILDENGKHTKPYENLERWVEENSPKK